MSDLFSVRIIYIHTLWVLYWAGPPVLWHHYQQLLLHFWIINDNTTQYQLGCNSGEQPTMGGHSACWSEAPLQFLWQFILVSYNIFHAHTNIHAPTPACTHARTHARTHTHTHTRTHTRTHTHTHTHTAFPLTSAWCHWEPWLQIEHTLVCAYTCHTVSICLLHTSLTCTHSTPRNG